MSAEYHWRSSVVLSCCVKGPFVKRFLYPHRGASFLLVRLFGTAAAFVFFSFFLLCPCDCFFLFFEKSPHNKRNVAVSTPSGALSNWSSLCVSFRLAKKEKKRNELWSAKGRWNVKPSSILIGRCESAWRLFCHLPHSEVGEHCSSSRFFFPHTRCALLETHHFRFHPTFLFLPLAYASPIFSPLPFEQCFYTLFFI